MTEITAPKQIIALVETLTEITAIVPQQQAVIVEVRRGPTGPVGPTGPQGPAGALGDLPDGTNTGDIIRYNAVTGDWESCTEPFEFQGLILVPMALPGSPVEGFVAYNITDNGLYVAVE
jgi:hypothetical protein